MTAAHRAAIKRGIQKAKEARMREKSQNANLKQEVEVVRDKTQVEVLEEEIESLRRELLRVYRLFFERM